ncbi:unnamed protein product [Sphagnum balticum]
MPRYSSRHDAATMANATLHLMMQHCSDNKCGTPRMANTALLLSVWRSSDGECRAATCNALMMANVAL